MFICVYAFAGMFLITILLGARLIQMIVHEDQCKSRFLLFALYHSKGSIDHRRQRWQFSTHLLTIGSILVVFYGKLSYGLEATEIYLYDLLFRFLGKDVDDLCNFS